MELRQVEHFMAVAEERSFTRAARRAHIAQSGLSASIKALETDLGVRLFQRSTRKVLLTGAGRALLPAARKLLEGAHEARRTVAAVAELESGSLALGAIPTAGRWWGLAEALGRFHRLHPGLDLRVATGDSRSLVDRVAGGDLDVALVTEPARLTSGLATTPVSTASYVLARAATSEAPARRPAAPEDLAGEPFVELVPGTVIREVVDRAFAAAGVRRSVRFEVGDLHTLLSMVQQGLGVACLPEMPRPRPDGLELVPLSGPWPRWTLSVVAPADEPAPPARAFLRMVERELPLRGGQHESHPGSTAGDDGAMPASGTNAP